MVGTARRIFDMALAYAKERKQFDVPIGSFQAIQHKLADMSLALERATAAVHYAAMTIDGDDPERGRACHVAKAAAGEAARRILKDGIQIHGGIGYTWEHDLHLYLRRATADEYLLGTDGLASRPPRRSPHRRLTRIRDRPLDLRGHRWTDAPPVLNQINLVVRDMDAMLGFYRTLGVDIASDRSCRGTATTATPR